MMMALSVNHKENSKVWSIHFMRIFLPLSQCDSTDVVLDAIPAKVKEEMNSDLCKPYIDAEIEAALFQMGPTKAPGPDGFPALFYQTHWEFFKEEIYATVRSFLGGGEIPKGLCDSVGVLIPKVAKPKHLKNFSNKFVQHPLQNCLQSAS
jgi:hypothetical protein